MKIAIILPSGHFFNTPCVPNLAKSLAEKGFVVDLFIARNLATPGGKLEVDRLSIKWFPLVQKNSKENVISLTIGFTIWLSKFFLKKRYHYVIACGIRALFLTGFLALIFRFKYIYNSLEIYSGKRFASFEGMIFKYLERFFNRKAVFSLIQDECRAELLRKVNHLQMQPVLIFPNSPLIISSNDLKEKTSISKKYNIPQEKKIILYSGSFNAEWSGFKKIISIANQFPKDNILFLQSRMEVNNELNHIVSKELNDSINSGKVVFSCKPLSNEEYDDLTKNARVGLAWYESEDDNIRYVGLSSGKISRYLFHGKPVIINRLPMYVEICEKYHCGVVVDRIEDIPHGLDEIFKNYQDFTTGALKAYADLFEIEKYSNILANFLKIGL